MEDAQLKLVRAVRREVKRAASRARGDLPWTAPASDASVSSGASGDDGELTPEFIAAAEAVNRALARAVAEEVEDQLTDVLMCLGEETSKGEVLSYALARGFGVEVPQLLREAGYSPDASPPGSRDESPTGEPHPNAISAAPRDRWRSAASRYAHLLPPSARRDAPTDDESRLLAGLTQWMRRDDLPGDEDASPGPPGRSPGPPGRSAEKTTPTTAREGVVRGVESAPAGRTPDAGLAALRSIVSRGPSPEPPGDADPGTTGTGADFSTPAGLPGLSPVKLEAALSANATSSDVPRSPRAASSSTYDSASEKADFVSAASAVSPASIPRTAADSPAPKQQQRAQEPRGSREPRGGPREPRGGPQGSRGGPQGPRGGPHGPYDLVESPSLRPVRVQPPARDANAPGSAAGSGSARGSERGSARRRLLADRGEGEGVGDDEDGSARFLSQPRSPVEAVAAETRRVDANGATTTTFAPNRDAVAVRQTFAVEAETGAKMRGNADVGFEGEVGTDTPPEEEGGRPKSDAASDDWDTSSSEYDDEGFEDGLGFAFDDAREQDDGLRDGARFRWSPARRRRGGDEGVSGGGGGRSRRARSGAPPNVVEEYYSPAGAGEWTTRANAASGTTSASASASASATLTGSSSLAIGEGRDSVGWETTSTESGERGTVADDDGESRSVIYAARSPATPRLGHSPAKAAAAREAPREAAATSRLRNRAGFAVSFRRVAALAGAVAGVGGRPGLMTMPVRQKDWMVIHESTF